LRPDLFAVLGDKQVYLMSLLTKVIGVGPAIGASAHLPDLDIFCGRGGKDIIPLYRDLEGTQPNITAGLLKFLGDRFGSLVSAEELAAYVYAVLGCQAYTSRFWNELETPGPRIPITKNSELFQKAAKLGRKLIWLHTYGERFLPSKSEMEIPSGAAKAIQGISNDPAKYPEMFKYDPIAKEIHVGEGRFGPVPPQVWNFEISGLKVVQSWLAYRMKARAGKKSSPLDDIRPSRWIPRMTDELLELLWVLEATLAMEPELSSTLDAIVKDQCFAASKLPLPAETERQPPKDKLAEGDLIAIMEGAPFEEDEEIDDV
jgi:predicted helicase